MRTKFELLADSVPGVSFNVAKSLSKRSAVRARPNPNFFNVFQHSQRLAEITHDSLSLSLLAFQANEPTARTQQGADPRRHAETANRIECRVEANMSEVYLVLLLRGKARKALSSFQAANPSDRALRNLRP